MNKLQLSPYLQTLILQDCNEFEDVEINFEKEMVMVPSKFPGQQHFLHLLSVHIDACRNLLNLNWLIHASKLQSLTIANCEMKKVIEDKRSIGSEIEPGLSMFSRLIYLNLFCLRKLNSIHGRALPFPSLRRITVSGCPRLKKLQFYFTFGLSKKLEEIKGEQEWWDGVRSEKFQFLGKG